MIKSTEYCLRENDVITYLPTISCSDRKRLKMFKNLFVEGQNLVTIQSFFYR